MSKIEKKTLWFDWNKGKRGRVEEDSVELVSLVFNQFYSTPHCSPLYLNKSLILVIILLIFLSKHQHIYQPLVSNASNLFEESCREEPCNYQSNGKEQDELEHDHILCLVRVKTNKNKKFILIEISLIVGSRWSVQAIGPRCIIRDLEYHYLPPGPKQAVIQNDRSLKELEC